MIIAYFLTAIAIIKISLMGFGSIALLVSGTAWLVAKAEFTGVNSALRHKFARVFAMGATLHLLVYAGLIAKLFFIDALEDIPAFLLSHLLMHHVMCALIAGVLTLMTVSVYLFRQQQKRELAL